MPEVQAWKCPETGMLFDRKRDYIAHLKAVASSRMELRKDQKLRAAIRRQRAFERHNNALEAIQRSRSIEDICDWIKDNPEQFMRGGLSVRRQGTDPDRWTFNSLKNTFHVDIGFVIPKIRAVRFENASFGRRDRSSDDYSPSKPEPTLSAFLVVEADRSFCVGDAMTYFKMSGRGGSSVGGNHRFYCDLYMNDGWESLFVGTKLASL